MNKKLFAGISMVAAVSAGFWACGEGNINEMTEMDNVISMQYPLDPATGAAGPELENLKEGALSSCKEDMGCYTQYQGYLEGTEPIETLESSSSEENQGPNTNPTMSSSSRGDVIIVTKPSSSSITVIDGPEPESSADIQITTPTSGLGSCAPASTPINKGSSVKWKFSGSQTAGYKPMDFAKATFAWSFPGGSPAADATPSTSAAITYANSGAASASLTLTMQDGKSEVIQCSPVQVNGDPITGCKCTSPEAKVDYLTQPDVSWTVEGCTSASDIISYTWDGVEGGAIFTKTFDAAQNGYTPKLVVGNADNTAIEVSCTTVKTTKGSEFTFEKPDTKIALPAGESSVEFDLPATWHNGTEGTCTFRCDGANQPITITIGTETSKADYSATLQIPIAKTINKTAMTVTLDVAANCQVGY